MGRPPREVYLCNKVTLEIVGVYSGVMDASRANGVSYSRIRSACDQRSVSDGRYIWRYAEDYDPNESFEGKCNRPVICVDMQTKKVMVFDTPKKADEALCFSRGRISESISEDTLVAGRFKFKYAR